MRRGRLIVIIAVLVVLVGACLGFLWWYLEHRNEQRIERYKAYLARDWKAIGEGAVKAAQVIATVRSVEDLDGVAEAVASLRKTVSAAEKRAGSRKAPNGYGDVGSTEEAALKSMDGYLEMVERLAVAKDPSTIESNRTLLQSRAQKAMVDLTDFLEEADFVRAAVPSDLFDGPESLDHAYHPEVDTKEKELVDVTLRTFMDAIVREFNPSVIWGLLAARRRAPIESVNVTPEQLGQMIQMGWGEHKPTDYYINWSDMVFSDPNNVAVKVLIYRQKANPEVQEFRLVREPDGWKIDNFPFLELS